MTFIDKVESSLEELFEDKEEGCDGFKTLFDLKFGW